jgi:hypothetical protein
MSSARPSERRPDDPRPEPATGNDLAASLWVLAVLLGLVELTWLFFTRIYSG